MACAAQSGGLASMGVKTNNPGKGSGTHRLETLATPRRLYKNIVKAAPLLITKEHLKDGKAQAVLANSGNANACAPNGEEYAEECCAAAAKALGLKASDFIVASTGVIGQTLPVEVIIDGIPELVSALRPDGSPDVAAAIMTTDTVMKECAVNHHRRKPQIGGIAMGSGMIHPYGYDALLYNHRLRHGADMIKAF